MKKIFKLFVLTLLTIFIFIQFIRPDKNTSASSSVFPNDISKVYHVPDDVQGILKTSCYDCHSNHTLYPWYSNIQPVTWWLNDHIIEGKKELNFSEFSSYRIGRQYRKLEEIKNEIEEKEMPLESYTFLHQDAKLSEDQKLSIANWANALRDNIKAQYPEDSLKRPQRSQPAIK